MDAGPTLLQASLSQRFHVIGARKTVRFMTRQCITCKRHSVKPQDQLLGQLPTERVAPPFDRTGVDYAGPSLIKYGYVRKPTVMKAYICLPPGPAASSSQRPYSASLTGAVSPLTSCHAHGST